jgi:hypothetical protein
MKGKIRKRLPEIKKGIKEFVSDEKGFVSKDKILKASFVLGMTSLLLTNTAVAQDTQHTNTVSGSWTAGTRTITGTHTHHGSHSHY